MRASSLTAAVLLAGFLAAPSARAQQTVATIYGIYDNAGFASLPVGVQNDPATAGRFNNGGSTYDTPSLFFVNPSAYSIIGAQMVLHVTAAANSGQATYNDGDSQTISLGTLGANTISQINWNGSTVPHNLFGYDYDDEYSNNYGAGLAGNSGSFANNCTLNAPGRDPEWTNFCAPVGNFIVTFTGILSGAGAANGLAVAAVFSEYDINGNYTGWQGLDAMGWSENADVDVHSGQVSGVLANIQIGSPDDINGSPITATPEPASTTLLATGLIGMAAVLRRRRSA